MKRLIAVAAISLCACVPAHNQLHSRVTGRVLDAASHNPISGARLHCAEYPAQLVVSSDSGDFDLPPLKEWHMAPVGGDFLSSNCTLVAEALNYRSSTNRVWFGNDLPQTVYLQAEK